MMPPSPAPTDQQPSRHEDAVEVTVLLPCRSEAASITQCVRDALHWLAEQRLHGEVLVVDNASIDHSGELARQAGARVVAELRPGYGRAVLTGVQHARGTFTIMLDADGSYTLADAGPLLQQLRDGSDLAVGDRYAGGITPGAMPALHRYLGNPALSWLTRQRTGSTIRDVNCGLRAFRTASIRQLALNSNGMELAAVMIAQATAAGQHLTQHPVTLRPDRRPGRSHLRPLRDGIRVVRAVHRRSPAASAFSAH